MCCHFSCLSGYILLNEYLYIELGLCLYPCCNDDDIVMMMTRPMMLMMMIMPKIMATMIDYGDADIINDGDDDNDSLLDKGACNYNDG